MKITKYVHSCLMVEMSEPVNRTALFDPGTMSEEALQVDKLQYLDDIIITHMHPDHLSPTLMKQLVAKFPEVRITAPPDTVKALAEQGITASSEPSDGIVFFNAPHEDTAPLFPRPDEIGVHYLDVLSDPGDSHSFNETKQILVLPVTAPWGSNIDAVRLALKLKPQYVLPVHDWHWTDAARQQAYGNMENALKQADITFMQLQTGQPVVIEI